MAEIRKICKENEILKDIKTTGTGRTKSVIIKEINERVKQMQESERNESTESDKITESPWPEFQELLTAIPRLDSTEHKRNAMMIACLLFGIIACVWYSFMPPRGV